jgi:hypothetical protein
MQTIVELPEFQHRKAKLLSELESTGIINYLAAERNDLAKLISLLVKTWKP